MTADRKGENVPMLSHAMAAVSQHDADFEDGSATPDCSHASVFGDLRRCWQGNCMSGEERCCL